jgi:dipeptidyl aminopeptidase/acylaminoacyl peptidase
VIALRLLFALMTLTLLVTPVAAQKRPLQLTDMSSLQNVSDPQLSPDGATIAYVRSRSDYATDKQTSDVILAATASGAPKATFAGSSRGARIPPPDLHHGLEQADAQLVRQVSTRRGETLTVRRECPRLPSHGSQRWTGSARSSSPDIAW